jgi:dihydroneopterin aldolase
VVDVEIETDLRRAGATDNLDETVNYSAVYAVVRDIVTGPPRRLIEAVAEEIAARILADHPSVERTSVRVRKPAVPIAGAMLASAEVAIVRDRSSGR